MKKIRYFIFVIFNMLYQDGNNDKTEPYGHCLMTILLLEFFTILVGMDLLNLFVGFSISKILISSCGGTHGFGVALLALVVPPNYYFFIKKKHFDHYYNEFRDAEMNTKENRKIGYICLILYVPICVGLMILLSL